MISISLRDTFTDWIVFAVVNTYGKAADVQISTLLRPVYHVTFWRILWKRIFQTFMYPHFSESVSSNIHQLWGSSFFGKCSKLNLDFENGQNNWENFFCFWDSCISRCWNSVCLLRREYFSLAVKLLKNISKIFHIFKRDFVQLNCLLSDEQIW